MDAGTPWAGSKRINKLVTSILVPGSWLEIQYEACACVQY